MKKAAVIGFPIAQSKSPLIHGHWLQVHGIEGSYEKIEVTPENFERDIRGLIDTGYAGCNVTVPHKEAARDISDELTNRARIIGAVNTLVFADGKIKGDNTDCEGFLENLKAGVLSWVTKKPALVLGAGGAARGIVYALLDAGVSEVRIANRTHARAEKLAEEFEKAEAVMWNDAEDHLGDLGLLVNTTALGMTGQDPLQISLETLSPDCVVTDIVYNPLETDLLKSAKSKGCKTVDGLGMLLHQAVPGFEAWFGTRPKVTPELRAKIEATL